MENLKFFLLATLLSTAAIYLSQSSSTEASQESYKQYVEWKAKYNKFHNGQEDEYRFNIFMENARLVEKINAEEGKKLVGLNVLADLSNVEFQERYINQMKQRHNHSNFSNFVSDPNFEAATEVNWVKKGAVTPVQDQGNCGSCWAFGTVGGLEGVYQVTTGTLKKLSEQQLVDCDKGNGGCNGGLEIYAYQYTQKNGIMTEASYPYTSGKTGRGGKCNFNSSDVVFKNTGYFELEENNTTQMVEALSKQPLSKGISASSIYFQLYSGDTIMDSKNCGTDLDHSVTLVGYSDESSPYWTIKNSWGTGWGWNGYMKIEKQMKKIDGVCGVNMDTTGAEYKK